jgi:hypothetical protein
MADDDDVMPDGVLYDARDEARFDEEPFDDVRAALSGLSHLDPARWFSDEEPIDEAPMPDETWERISLALASEASARAAATHDNVVLLPTAAAAAASAPSEQRGRHSRATRWGGGLVAASVVVVGVAFGVSTVNGTSRPPAIVSGPKLPPAAAAPNTASAQASAEAFAEAAAPTAEAAVASDAAGAANPAPAPKVSPTPAASGTQAGSGDVAIQPRSAVVQAARMVKDTGTDYQQEQLPQQVTALLDTVGVHSAGDIAVMPSATALPVGAGFTESWASVRDCVNWLMAESDAQALIVDRGTFEGDAAGVVVAPADPLDQKPSTPAPTLSLTTDAGLLHVWVVTPECQHVATSIEEEMVFDLQP